MYDGKCRHISEEERKKNLSTHLSCTYRFKVTSNKITFNDLVRGVIQFDTKLIGDFVIQKSDGYPTYNFAVVVDDALMGITTILRGDDHISNTPRQLLLYEALNFSKPTFGHISTILDVNKKKLSKRQGAADILQFKAEGYYPDALLNHTALLGWSPDDGIEIIARNKLEKSFKNPKFNASAAVFSREKLDFINAHYLRSLPFQQVYNDFLPYLKKSGVEAIDTLFIENEAHLKKMVEAVRPHCRKLSDIVDELKIFFTNEVTLTEEQKAIVTTDDALKVFDKTFLLFSHSSHATQTYIDQEEFKNLNQVCKQELNISGKKFFLPLRLKLTGLESGLDLLTLFQLVSRKHILSRLKFSILH